MINMFIIHGTYGSPYENWFPWLKKELEKLDCNVIIPKFPTPENQTLSNWLQVLEQYKEFLNEETIVIGHSLGVAFLLSILEESSIKAAFFVSGWLGPLNNPKFDELNKTFLEKDFDWNKIKQNCNTFYLFHSDNDPYVPLKKGKELAEKLDTEFIVLKNAGHFNTKSGYTKFELLLEKIKEILQP